MFCKHVSFIYRNYPERKSGFKTRVEQLMEILSVSFSDVYILSVEEIKTVTTFIWTKSLKEDRDKCVVSLPIKG